MDIHQFNWLDQSIVVLLGIAVVFGAVSGFLWQLARLVTFGVAIYACIFWHEQVAGYLQPYLQISSPAALNVVSYLTTFLGVYLVLFSLTLLLEKTARVTRLKPMDRFFGAVFGAAKAALIVGAILTGLVLYPSAASERSIEESRLAPYLLRAMRTVITAVPKAYQDRLGETLERLQSKQGAAERETPPPVGPDRPEPAGPDRGA